MIREEERDDTAIAQEWAMASPHQAPSVELPQSLFQIVRAGRALGYQPKRVILSLSREMSCRETPSAITAVDDIREFVLALIDVQVDEIDVRARLANAFLAGQPLEPATMEDRRSRELALAFYKNLESNGDEDEEKDFLSGAYAIAIRHAKHRKRAEQILDEAKRGRGQKRSIEVKVHAIVDDYLATLILWFHAKEQSLTVPSFYDKGKSKIFDSATDTIDLAECVLKDFNETRAEESRATTMASEVLAGIRDRRLGDRLRRIIKDLGLRS